MRRALRSATNNTIDTLTATQNGHYALRPDLVDVDLWHINDALHTRPHGTTERARIAALHEITQMYRGELAEGIDGDWIQAPREALRRDVLDALATLIHTTRRDDPEHALELLEQARQLDPHNEAIYRDILRTQAHLGHQYAIPHTLALLRTALTEIDTKPSPETLALAAEVQRTSTATRRQANQTNANKTPW